jgi:hypothetical protein
VWDAPHCHPSRSNRVQWSCCGIYTPLACRKPILTHWSFSYLVPVFRLCKMTDRISSQSCSLPLVLTLWSIFWFVLSVTSRVYNPGIVLSPAFWGRWLRFGTLSLVGCLAIAVAIVAWFFRTRQQMTLQPMSMPHIQPIMPVHPPPAYMSYFPPSVAAAPPIVDLLTPYSVPLRDVYQPTYSRYRRRRSSQVAAETFRPERHSV